MLLKIFHSGKRAKKLSKRRAPQPFRCIKKPKLTRRLSFNSIVIGPINRAASTKQVTGCEARRYKFVPLNKIILAFMD